MAVGVTVLAARGVLAQPADPSTPKAKLVPASGQAPQDARVDLRAADRANARPRVGLRSVEAGVGDVGPLSTSTRELRVDLRQPANFDRVYALPTRNGVGGRTPGGFVRFDSGIAAVFPRSEYTPTPWGPVADIPAGTTFYIGRLPDSMLQAGAQARSTPSVLRIDHGIDRSVRTQATTDARSAKAQTRVDTRAVPDRPAAPSADEKPSILNDPKLRERWIDSLGQPAPGARTPRR
jgi:hypothetical protein